MNSPSLTIVVHFVSTQQYALIPRSSNIILYHVRRNIIVIFNGLSCSNSTFSVKLTEKIITSYARNSKYSSRGLASIGRPLTNNVLTCKNT